MSSEGGTPLNVCAHLTGLFEPQLHGEVSGLVSASLGHQEALCALFGAVLQQLSLSLSVHLQQPRAQSLVQPQEEVPVIVDEEQVVDAVLLLLQLQLFLLLHPVRRRTSPPPRLAVHLLLTPWRLSSCRCSLSSSFSLRHRHRGRLRQRSCHSPDPVLSLNLLVRPVLGVAQLTAPGEEQVGDEVVDDALDLVLVLFVNGGLTLHMIDD